MNKMAIRTTLDSLNSDGRERGERCLSSPAGTAAAAYEWHLKFFLLECQQMLQWDIYEIALVLVVVLMQFTTPSQLPWNDPCWLPCTGKTIDMRRTTTATGENQNKW